MDLKEELKPNIKGLSPNRDHQEPPSHLLRGADLSGKRSARISATAPFADATAVFNLHMALLPVYKLLHLLQLSDRKDFSPTTYKPTSKSPSAQHCLHAASTARQPSATTHLCAPRQGCSANHTPPLKNCARVGSVRLNVSVFNLQPSWSS